MEKLDIALRMLKKALLTLKDAFEVLEFTEQQGYPKVIRASKDSIVQRFEYSYDGFWKVLRHYLRVRYSILNANSPKEVFRQLVLNEICSEEEGDLLVEMANDRNETTHSYNSDQTDEISERIPKYYECMMNIVSRIK